MNVNAMEARSHPDFDVNQGQLPVRVLLLNMLAWFENVSDSFLDEVVAEIKYRGLDPAVACIVARGPVTEACSIETIAQSSPVPSLRGISIHENFLQLLWCVSYAMIAIYREGYKRPIATGTFTGQLDRSIPHVKKALLVAERGSMLLKMLQPELYFDIPNPETPHVEDLELVMITNGVFAAGAAFILLHEVGHQYYDHLSYRPEDDVAKCEEFDADHYAANWFKKGLGVNPALDNTATTGVMAAMITLLLMHKDLKGGDRHPDPDVRMLKVLDHLNRPDDDLMWLVGSFGLPMWTATHSSITELDDGSEHETRKSIFVSALKLIAHQTKPE